MPSVAMHVKFDEYLAERGVLLHKKTYPAVHKFMDKGAKIYGPQHREIDPFHTVERNAEALRSWINGKYAVVGPDTATDFLRSGYGHIALDIAVSKLYKTYGQRSIFDSAYRSMIQRGWHKKFFKPS